MPKALTIYDNQTKKYLKYGYGSEDDIGDLEAGRKTYEELYGKFGDRFEVKVDDLPYQDDTQALRDSLQLDSLGTQSRTDALRNPETVDPEQERLNISGKERSAKLDTIYSELDQNIQAYNQSKTDWNGANLLKTFKRLYDKAVEEGDGERSATIKKKFYDTFGAKYDINKITALPDMPVRVKGKGLGERMLQDIFTTAPELSMERGASGMASLEALVGPLDLPARIVGKLAGKGEISDEDTKILRDQIEENREYLAKALAKDDGFRKYAEATGRVVNDLIMQVLSNPVDAVMILKALARGGIKTLTDEGIKLSAPADPSIRARLIKRGFQTPDATIEQWISSRPKFFASSKPTQEALDEIKKVFAIVDDVEARNIYQKIRASSEEGTLTSAITDILKNEFGSEFNLSGTRRPVQFPSDVERQKYLQGAQDAVVEYTDDITEEMVGSNVRLEFLDDIKKVRSELDEQLKILKQDTKQARFELADERLAEGAEQRKLSIQKMESDLDYLQKRVDNLGEYGAKSQLGANKQAIKENIDRVNAEIAQKKLEIRRLRNKEATQRLDGDKIQSVETKRDILSKERQMIDEADPELGKQTPLKQQIDAQNAEIEADNKILQETIANAQKDKTLNKIDLKTQKIELAKNSKIQELRERINEMSQSNIPFEQKDILEKFKNDFPESTTMTLAQADKARVEINKFLSSVNYWDTNRNVPLYQDLHRFGQNLTSNIKRAVIRGLDEDEAKKFSATWDKYIEDTQSIEKAKRLIGVNKGDLPEEISTKVNTLIDSYLRVGGEKNIKETEKFISGLSELSKVYGVDFAKVLDDAVDATKSVKTGWRGNLYMKTAKDVGRKGDNASDLMEKVLRGVGDGVKNTIKYAGIGAVTGAEQLTGQQIKFLDEMLHLSKGAWLTDEKIGTGVLSASVYAIDKMIKATGMLPKGMSEYEIVKSVLRGIEAGDDALKIDYDQESREMLAKRYPDLKPHFDKYFNEKSNQLEINPSFLPTELPDSRSESNKNKILGHLNDFFRINSISGEDLKSIANKKAKEAFDYMMEKAGFEDNEDAFKKMGVKVSEGVKDLNNVDKIAVVLAPYVKSVFDSIGGNMIVTSGFREKGNENSAHRKGLALDLRGQSSDGTTFHPDVKLERVREGVYKPVDEKTKEVISSIEKKLTGLKGIKKAVFEYGDPKTYDSKQFAPHFHIEFEDIGMTKSEINVIAEILGYELSVGANVDNFAGDEGRNLEFTDVDLKKKGD